LSYSGLCTCGHGGDKHTWNESPQVCVGELSCKCRGFELATPDRPAISQIDKYIQSFETISDRVKWLLENIKYLRNLNNLGFVISYWELACGIKFTEEQKRKMVDPEVIRRSKQKLVEHNPEKYGEFSPTVQEQKIIKQYSMEQWIIEAKTRFK
jgi:hypothetical protein